jgi:hypothetical protein
MVKAPSTTAVGRAADDEDSENPHGLGGDRRFRSLGRGELVAAIVLLAGIVLRFWARSPLWLDEALSVDIAGLPLGDIPSALLRDGAPPLYYFLLHLWMELFGSGDFAVRALSGVLSVATLPAVWIAGRRLGGRSVATWAVVIFAVSPFAIRYATETRMYALVVFLVAWGYLALARTLRDPSAWSVVSVAALSASLALTHYWALYLLLVTGAFLIVRVVKAPDARGAKAALLGLVVGALLFLPWAPKFLYQFQHTGTPWASSPPFGSLFNTPIFWAGGPLRAGPLLGIVFFGLIVLALFGRASGENRIELRPIERPEAAALAVIVFATLVVAYAAGVIGHSTFADRYTSVVFPLFVLIAALGLCAIGNATVRTSVLALIVVCGLINSVGNVGLVRTQAGHVARQIAKKAQPNDVVVYCPDQLGPAVSRELPSGFQEVPYPAAGDPRFVDWVDYEERNRSSDPIGFARMLEERVPEGGSIWLVSAPGYRTFGRKCTQLKAELAEARPGAEPLVRRKSKSQAWEREELSVYPAP